MQEKLIVRAPQGLPPRMVADYVDRYRSSLPVLREALDRDDYEQARIFGHRLKGTGGAYGIAELTAIGARIEEAARERNPDQLRCQAAAMELCLERIEVLTD